MSGHSKWATTKRQKAVVDAKRGALFTKIGNQIAIAARSGTDPTMNPSLAMVLEKARLANMPKANIERAIARVEDKNAAALKLGITPRHVNPVEIKMTGNPKATMGRTNQVLDKIPDKKRGMGVILCLVDRKVYLRENLIALPIEYI